MGFDYSPEMADRYYAEYPFPGAGWFAVCLRATGGIVGRAGLLLRGDLYDPPEIELAYGIAEEHRRKGYAVEAAKALVVYAAEELRLSRFFAGVHVDNLASRRVAEKCGLDAEETVEWYGEKHTMYWLRWSARRTVLKNEDTQHDASHGPGAAGAEPGQ